VCVCARARARVGACSGAGAVRSVFCDCVMLSRDFYLLSIAIARAYLRGRSVPHSTASHSTLTMLGGLNCYPGPALVF